MNQSLAGKVRPGGGWSYQSGQGDHPEPTSLALLALSLDAERFTEACKKAGAPVDLKVEPVKALAGRFEEELDLKLAAGELGLKILNRVADQVSDLAKVEAAPKVDGRNMIMVLAPDRRAQQAAAKAKSEHDREEAEAAADSDQAANGDTPQQSTTESIQQQPAATPVAAGNGATPTGGNDALEIHVSEWTGINQVTPLDQTSVAAGNGTQISSGSQTTTESSEPCMLRQSWCGDTFQYTSFSARCRLLKKRTGRVLMFGNRSPRPPRASSMRWSSDRRWSEMRC